MNAIILEPIRETLLSNSTATTLASSTDETVGWKTEAQRLAQSVKRGGSRDPR